MIGYESVAAEGGPKLLEGTYNMELVASWELPPANPREDPNASGVPRTINPGAPSIFTALPAQLGLKLLHETDTGGVHLRGPRRKTVGELVVSIGRSRV